MLYNGRTGEAFDNTRDRGLLLHLEAGPPGGRQDPRPLHRPLLHDHPTAPGREGPVRWPAVRRDEVWALEAYGAAYCLQELLTVKSDDVLGRVKVYEAIVKGANMPDPGIPESFKCSSRRCRPCAWRSRSTPAPARRSRSGRWTRTSTGPPRNWASTYRRPERGSDEEDARREAERRARDSAVTGRHIPPEGECNDGARTAGHLQRLGRQRVRRLRIGLATADSIRTWSNGEVKKPETINYRTLKPEKDGLFCEKIFGPQKDWECSCGKYKRIRFRGIICERCGVEVTRTKVRRERMGTSSGRPRGAHLVPARHPLLAGVPAHGHRAQGGGQGQAAGEGRLLRRPPGGARGRRASPHRPARAGTGHARGVAARQHRIRRAPPAVPAGAGAEIEELETGEGTGADIRNRRGAVERELEELEEERVEELEKIENAFEVFQTLYPRQIIEDEELWNELRFRYADYFDGGMGADAIARLISESRLRLPGGGVAQDGVAR